LLRSSANARTHSKIVLRKGVVDRSQRDDSIDKLLRSTFLRDRTTQETSDACTDPETIAAWTAGTLTPQDAGAVERHLAACTACQQVLALLARTEPPPPPPGFSWNKWHLRWAVPVAAAATAVALWVAVPDRRTVQIEEPSATSPKRTTTDQAQMSSEATPRADLDKREEPRPPAAANKLEARADTQAGTGAAASARESDAIASAAPAAPEAAGVPQQSRTLADAPAELLRQRREAFAGPVEVASPDPLVRWRILPTRTLERTTNGGRTWDAIALPQAVELTAVRVPNAATAIVTATDGRQFRTDDQGRTWNPVQP
jgi:hypothetical protein